MTGPDPPNVGLTSTRRAESPFVRRVTVAFAIGAAFAAGFLLLAYAADVVILSFAAVWFGCVLHHAAAALGRQTGLPFRWATGIVLGVVVASAVGFVVLLGLQIAGEVDELVRNLSDAVDQLRRRLAGYPQLERLIDRSASPGQAVQVVTGKTGSTVKVLLTTPVGLLVNVLFVLFTGAYFAFSPAMYRDGFVAKFRSAGGRR